MQTPAQPICERLNAVMTRIRDAERRYGRPSGSVTLLAASKTQPAERLLAAHACGQRLFGENYAQEMTDKMAALTALDIEWHFIGPIQSNKTKFIAEADWAHGIERLKIAERLDAQRNPDRPPLQVCVQVNVSGEASKSGVAPVELPALAEAVAQLPRLRLRGVMAIPAPETDFDAERRAFAAVRHAFEDLQRRGHALDTLSMGMSDDLEAAIAEGATMVRIGTAIFGPRNQPDAPQTRTKR
ncbi:MAG: YggS family pyridoxal phosphate-dependent enzyme [Chromatiales bacterium]|jgi:pyridoxal phosphate enzyme (YggS family)|nr:YggS family pyridoxal phosphate-dependent enzyme [Chromatiales bacterium]MDX9767426.1 YggS family pyridoxal phosphate-dependent enzyme [Ectothiorhodospiraceae bacterium]